MIGSWRWNVIVAAAIALLIFLLSFSSNPMGTAAYRSGVSLVIAFAVTYAVRWLLGGALKTAAPEAAPQPPEAEEEAGKGQTIDAVTPEDDADPFTSLTPPKLKRTDDVLDPEQLAQALRHISEK